MGRHIVADVSTFPDSGTAEAVVLPRVIQDDDVALMSTESTVVWILQNEFCSRLHATLLWTCERATDYTEFSNQFPIKKNTTLAPMLVDL